MSRLPVSARAAASAVLRSNLSVHNETTDVTTVASPRLNYPVPIGRAERGDSSIGHRTHTLSASRYVLSTISDLKIQ